ncbi:MAG: OFA family MFS transporter [Armatimonadetes bacterium]|nr:OFA family MFS transporter [Armatimonadota bacterium]
MSNSAKPEPRAVAGPLTRWKVLVGAIIVQLILGTVYGYSIFWQPLEDALYPAPIITVAEQTKLETTGQSLPANAIVLSDADAKKKHDERQAPLKQAFALAILTFALTMVYAGKVQDAKGPRYPALIGSVLLGAGFLAAGALLSGKVSDANQVTMLLWLFIGVVAGAGIGFAYVCPIAALVKWFPDAKGLVSGIAVAGFGFGAFIISYKALPFSGTVYIKEHSISQFFLVHGVVCLVAVALGALLLSNPPGTVPAVRADGGPGELLKNKAFYMIWMMFFSGALAGLTVIGVAKGFAGEQLVANALGSIDAETKKSLMEKGAAAVGMLAVFNAIGRVVWGTVSDKIGRTPTFIAMFLFQTVMMFLLPAMKTEIAITLAAGMVGFNFGGNFALFPSATAELFGAKKLGQNYGLVFTSYGVAGVVGIQAGNIAKTVTGSYSAAFALAGLLCLVSAILAIALHITSKRGPAAASAS